MNPIDIQVQKVKLAQARTAYAITKYQEAVKKLVETAQAHGIMGGAK